MCHCDYIDCRPYFYLPTLPLITTHCVSIKPPDLQFHSHSKTTSEQLSHYASTAQKDT